MEGLSPRQSEIFDYIRDAIQNRGVCPSYREIGEHMGIRSTNAVSDHIKALIRKGWLERVDTGRGPLARALTLGPNAGPSRNDDVVEVSVYGRVAAGMPALAVENREDVLKVDRCMLPHSAEEVFALRVFGESMILDGVFPGDYIFVRKQLQVAQGEMAVVMVDGEATVKRYYREQGRIRLQPANDGMEPIYINEQEFKQVDILGAVVAVYRRLD